MANRYIKKYSVLIITKKMQVKTNENMFFIPLFGKIKKLDSIKYWKTEVDQQNVIKLQMGTLN